MEGAKILIVEDDLDEAAYLQLKLLHMGHQVVAKLTSGEACLQFLDTHQVDLLIIDIVLEGRLNGIDTAEQIQQRWELPVIFLTSCSDDEFLQQAEQARPYAYLLKPFRLQEIEFLIRMSLTRCQIERALKKAQADTEKKLRQALSIIEHTSDAVVMTNSQSRIEFVNQAFVNSTGYSEQELLGQKPKLLSSERHNRQFFDRMWQSLGETDHWNGEIWNRRKNGEIFHQWLNISAIYDVDGQLTHYVGIYSDISAIKRSEAELRRLAHHDVLTELPNRALLNTHLQHAIQSAHRNQECCAVLFIDLDGFKVINDNLGHLVGDLVLKAVAQRFIEALREVDLVARLGGDEFVVVLEKVAEPAAAASVAGKLIESLADAVVVKSQRLTISCSIGIASYPSDGQTSNELIHNADAAMYRAKSQGGRHYSFYDSRLAREALHHVQCFNELRLAVKHQAFTLHFQPQFDLASSALNGMEALVRWQGGQGELLAPSEFLPLAEESGLINGIGEWVLRTACAQMVRWRAEGHEVPRIAVNISRGQLTQGTLPELVAQVLAETGLAGEQLELEIAEAQLTALMCLPKDDLQRLRALNVRLVVDHFGSAASSLNCLLGLQVAKLKLDPALVAGCVDSPASQQVIRASVAMAAALDIEVLALGVETSRQRDWLQAAGCRAAQGFQLAAPAAAESVLLASLSDPGGQSGDKEH